MNKILYSFLLFFCISVYSYGQTREEILNAIEKEKAEIERINREIAVLRNNLLKMSRPIHNQAYTLNNGSTIKYHAEENFSNGNFKLSDQNTGIFTEDEIIALYTTQYNQKSTFHILAHTLSDAYLTNTGTLKIGNRELLPEDIAQIIQSHMQGYESTIQEPFAVVLHSCKAGWSSNGKPSFAARLSKILHGINPNFYVVAPPDRIYPFLKMDGQKVISYKETAGPTKEYVQRSGIKGTPWVVFNNNQPVNGVSDPDFKNVIGHIQQLK